LSISSAARGGQQQQATRAVYVGIPAKTLLKSKNAGTPKRSYGRLEAGAYVAREDPRASLFLLALVPPVYGSYSSSAFMMRCF
jgi:hypothetical protein